MQVKKLRNIIVKTADPKRNSRLYRIAFWIGSFDCEMDDEL